MGIYKTDKKVLEVRNNASAFLNGITSNTMGAPRNAFLNIHGRIIAVFDQTKVDEDTYWLIMENNCLQPVISHISRYAALSNAQVEELARKVYFDLDNSYSLQPDERAVEQKQGRLIISPRELNADVSEEEFKLFRLRHGIPRQGEDFHDEMILNVSVNEFVSFTKGCYLGQEPVSKVYNRSRPTWKLVVKKEKECNEAERQKMTSRCVDPESGETSGFVFVKNEG